MYRMRFISVLLVTVVLEGIPAAAQDMSNAVVDAIVADLTKPGSPGCAFGIYRDGKIVYAKGYGLPNIEESVPITPRSMFDVGSVSKQFTAASIPKKLLLFRLSNQLGINLTSVIGRLGVRAFGLRNFRSLLGPALVYASKTPLSALT